MPRGERSARRVVPQLYPADVPLSRERAKAPYNPAEIGGYLALADAQPTLERRMPKEACCGQVVTFLPTATHTWPGCSSLSMSPPMVFQ